MDMDERDASELDNVGQIKHIDIDEEMRGSYLDYAMSVIVSRALPDARDGLKPVHRRILYAMYDMGLRPNRSHKKSARIVGEVLGKYHPHGDSAVYDAMVRMAQDFSMRYPLVDGQGNFGSVDGDSPAAMRYTEARLANIAMEMLQDIDMDTVDFIENFDGSLEEPDVLPARIPNLLLSGTSGIAVGMATNIPPHNLTEVCNACIYMLDHWDRLDDVTVQELMNFVKGPDFPTAARILGQEGISQAYATGKGTVTIRARAEIEDMGGGRQRIVVTELPFQVNKASLIEKMAEMVRDGRLDKISDLRDESDRDGLRVVIELKRGAFANKLRNQLYKYTQLQTNFGVNMLALVDGMPRRLPLKQALYFYLRHRVNVIIRRSEYELEKARARAHVLEGLLRAMDDLDAVIETIRQSPSADEALAALIERFEFSETQARAILDMQLRRLAALERQKLLDEYDEVTARIDYLTDLLAHPRKIRAVIHDDLEDIIAQYGDERRTQIMPGMDASFAQEDLIPNIPVLISLTEQNYIKRVPTQTFRTQRRGGRGVKGMKTHEEDEIMNLFAAQTHDDVLFFTDKGKVYQSPAYYIPDFGRTAKGVPLVNVINIAPDEAVTATVPVREWDSADYLVMLTRKGRIKRVDLSEFESVRPSGLIALNLDDDDELNWVKLTHGDDELIIVTRHGQAIRFHEDDVRSMGRTAAGVWAIKLEGDDEIAAMDVVDPDGDLLVVTQAGFGKRVALSEFSTQKRYGKGVRAIARAIKRTGPIIDARVVEPENEVTLMSTEGIIIRTKVKQISRMGRTARGVYVMRLDKDDSVASMALLDGVLVAEQEDEE